MCADVYACIMQVPALQALADIFSAAGSSAGQVQGQAESRKHGEQNIWHFTDCLPILIVLGGGFMSESPPKSKYLTDFYPKKWFIIKIATYCLNDGAKGYFPGSIIVCPAPARHAAYLYK